MLLRLLKLLLGCLAVLLVLLVGAVLFTPNFNITSWRLMIGSITGSPGPQASVASVRQELVPAAGFSLGLYAGDVPKARFLRPTRSGDLLVSQPRLGQITLLARDADHDGKPDRQEILIADLDRPHGMDIANGWLYIAENGAVGRIAFDVETGRTSGAYQRILGGIPDGGSHWSRTVRIGPDGWMYVTVGSSCNACVEEHPWRASMLRARPDGSEPTVHASGLRNSVGFDWAPWNDELYATDNGRDMLGDDFPPCELNHIVANGFYGWPYINGFGKLDPDNGSGKDALLASARSPAYGFRAHTAPLGITFLRSPTRAPALQRAALVALHGSWNRSIPDGYKVVLLTWDDSDNIVESDFLSGFERDGKVIGRPVDVAEAADGTVFVSDDYAGAIYTLVPGSSGNTLAVAAPPSTVGARPDPLAGVPAQQIAEANRAGSELIKRHACLGCHAPGTAVGARLDTLAARYTLEELGNFFLLPTAPMPIFPLSDTERRLLAIHLLSRVAH